MRSRPTIGSGDAGASAPTTAAGRDPAADAAAYSSGFRGETH